MKGRMLANRYELLETIGQGGMAIVYKAMDTLLNRTVAVKILKQEFNENEQFIKKFRRESQAAASLSHNNIVNVFDVGVEDNIHFIVMEYVEGDTLKDYIRKKGKLNWKEAVYIAKQIAFALDHAHKNNIIHRDIKPHNIMINEETIPKVTDFGIARAITSSTITLVEETMGSVHYISPEQARGGFVDERSDLYSLGIVMYEMLTGRVPFDGDNSISVAIKHIQEEIEFLEDDLDDIPESLEDIVLKLIRKNPKERYENAKELVKDLIAVQSGEKIAGRETKKPGILPGILATSKPKPVVEKPSEKKPKEGKMKKTTMWILGGLILLFLAVILLSSRYFSVNEVSVPSVEGMNILEAAEKLEEEGLKYEIERTESSATIPEDYIISQNPNPGTILKEGQTVKLVVSSGPREAEVPDVTGKFEVEGVQELENLNFTVKEISRQFNDDVEKDKIYDQNPRPGLMVKEGAEIIIYVSKGKDTAVVEDFVGMSLEDARRAITALGLQVGEVREVVSDKHGQGIVENQDPKPNAEVAKNSVVSLTVSKGKLQTKDITINIGRYIEYDDDDEVPTVSVKVTLIDQSSNSSVVYERNHKADETISVTLEGLGVQYYQIEIDGEKFGPEIITF
ncbi:Stk1 family PASTA domain-containing Ser/Thr kinase [Alkalibacter saccharofermentans]|uniref:non-specific serine/threonine protein kinase n=1 Tax=Alkalibacter saccharofermentans DSM 14828 TaxID=1120975 RepID=A0A1M4S557_9FIRM|nr:Stk1 family PASTA domain-containing Ser/Thr kinase [Alkalibacter saccharofermentans]SHE27331.1 serine/threonine protein kinase [Alkalibacter saccharofermentans DSM 14828]